MTGSKTTISLACTAYLQVPTDLPPTFSFHKPRSIFKTLETIFEMLDHCLPGVGFTAINYFLFHHHSSPCLWILLAVSGRTWFTWALWSQALLHPCTLVMGRERERKRQGRREKRRGREGVRSREEGEERQRKEEGRESVGR